MKVYNNKNRQSLIVFIGLLFMLPFATLAKSPVYKISNNKNHLYIGGTVHVLSGRDYPLPKSFDKAYKSSKKIIFEVHPDSLSSTAAASKMMAEMTYSDGSNLKDNVSESVYSELNLYLNARNVPIENLSRFNPVGVSFMLTLLELQKLGFSDAAGVDMYFGIRAKKDNKKIGELETIEQQANFIASLKSVDGNSLILSTLQDLKILKTSWVDLLMMWRQGDVEKIDVSYLQPMIQDFPKIYQALLVQRNNDWIDKIESLLNTKEKEFILVGALHLAGEEGLISQLSDLGYKIEQMD